MYVFLYFNYSEALCFIKVKRTQSTSSPKQDLQICLTSDRIIGQLILLIILIIITKRPLIKVPVFKETNRPHLLTGRAHISVILTRVSLLSLPKLITGRLAV